MRKGQAGSRRTGGMEKARLKNGKNHLKFLSPCVTMEPLKKICFIMMARASDSPPCAVQHAASLRRRKSGRFA